MKQKKKRRLVLLGVVLLICGIALVFGIPRYIDWYAQPFLADKEGAPVCDAILVLGAYVENGAPSPVLEDRLLCAYDLYQEGKAEKIIVSGDHGRADYDEVNVMRQYLMELGVPREKIFMDHAGFDTYDSMYRAKCIFQVESLLISTQEFHIRRAVYNARRLGIDAYGVPCPDKESYNMPYLNAREHLAKLKGFWDTDLLRRRPKYEGEVIPIWKSGILTDG